MILDSMLSHSPVFLFVMSAFLLAVYGAVRFIRAGFQLARHWLSHGSARSSVAHS